MAMSCPGLDSKWVRAPGQSLPKPCERAGQTRQRPVTKAADTDSEAPTASAERLHAGLRAVAGAVVIASASSIFAQPAAAWSSNGSHKFHEWKPRRHHRRLEDRERSVTLGPNPKAGPAHLPRIDPQESLPLEVSDPSCCPLLG